MAHADDDRVNDVPAALKGTNYPDLFAALASPLAPHEVKSRVGGGGRQLSYITATTVANRLDEVLGPENWDFEVAPWGTDALIGTLIVRLPDGSTVRKSNVGGKADMAAEDDATKSAASDCLKRCAMLLGIGRYLYRDSVPGFVLQRYEFEDITPDRSPAPAPQRGSWGGGQGGGSYGGGDRDSEYRQSRPASEARPASGGQQQRGGNGGGQAQGGGFSGVPKSGKGLFAWTKDMEQKHDVGLLKYLNGWGKYQQYPDRMVDWDPDQVAAAYAEAVRKLQSLGAGAGGAASSDPADDDDRPY